MAKAWDETWPWDWLRPKCQVPSEPHIEGNAVGVEFQEQWCNLTVAPDSGGTA